MSRNAVLSPPPPSIGGLSLPASTQSLLSQLLAGLDGEAARCRHEATRSAAQTQSVLPPGTLVQKTLSVVFGDGNRTCVLWTGVGDFQISKASRLLVAAWLGLPPRAARNATINPPWLDPVAAFGMHAGMVSPFLPPPSAERQAFPIAALVMQQWPRAWEASKRVAISLALEESLLIPLRTLRPLLLGYYALAHPAMPCLLLAADGGSSQAATHAATSLLAFETGMAY